LQLERHWGKDVTLIDARTIKERPVWLFGVPTLIDTQHMESFQGAEMCLRKLLEGKEDGLGKCVGQKKCEEEVLKQNKEMTPSEADSLKPSATVVDPERLHIL
jgi:hypothetical protein